MLDIDKIRQLVDMMIANDLVEISLRDGDVEVNLRRPAPNTGVAAPMVTGTSAGGAPISIPNPAPSPAARVAAETSAVKAEEPEIELVQIKSPMVGTFYSGPDPDSPSYVEIGSVIHADSVVCIVEAMKVFNEIKAEVTGTIERILVQNEQPVEYGQPMFLVRPE